MSSIIKPNLHAENQTRAAGTILGAGTSNIFVARKLTARHSHCIQVRRPRCQVRGPRCTFTLCIHGTLSFGLQVISVEKNTPWHRIAEYEIPADLPACDDCVCAWSWAPNHCGIPNEVRYLPNAYDAC